MHYYNFGTLLKMSNSLTDGKTSTGCLTLVITFLFDMLAFQNSLNSLVFHPAIPEKVYRQIIHNNTLDNRLNIQ